MKQDLLLYVIIILQASFIFYTQINKNNYKIIPNSQYSYGTFLLNQKTGQTWRYTRSSSEDEAKGHSYEVWASIQRD